MIKRFKLKWIGLIALLGSLAYGAVFIWSINETQTNDELLVHDVSRLFPVEVMEIIEEEEEEGIIQAVYQAQEHDLKISIAGTKHSQGGHAFYEDSLHLDMTSFNKILSLDEEEKTIRVQSGATWSDIQDYIHPYGLSVAVMQSSNIFTVGGSLSSNVHGRDVRFGPLIETVKSFRLLQADGSIIEVSREEHPELFSLVIGGFGLFGVILDVELQLADNVWYEEHNEPMDYQAYPSYFEKHVLGDPDVDLHIARLSVAPDHFLTGMYAHNYKRTDQVGAEQVEALSPLTEEKNVKRDQFLFGLSRHFDWGKSLVWGLQQQIYDPDEVRIVNRNNAMRPPIEFLEYTSSKDTDILQEYFIPIEHYTAYVDDLRELLVEEDINIMNITVRYVPQHDEAFLSYSEKETFAFVFLINQGLTEKDREHMEAATQRLVDLADQYNGTYYLTYQRYPSLDQLQRMYPDVNDFFALKRHYDPEERFMNEFYEYYQQQRELTQETDERVGTLEGEKDHYEH
ncbi:FAD-binding protein [Caldalkalibacillus salinus]|uniref:FAD-binding protein n=1 Tax=Caldalkalibacillus salinus TaxID=2803787 RepID=UPI00192168E9|nr:FAD-binding oxidoreductase [Caldalkalibacillus salinus]